MAYRQTFRVPSEIKFLKAYRGYISRKCGLEEIRFHKTINTKNIHDVTAGSATVTTGCRTKLLEASAVT